ncbi:DegV family protein [Neobacillus niacini]|nr:DegV family protein [Neobacillus niacini]
MIKIISDSSADLPKELIEKYDITLVPLTVTT